MTRPKQVVYWDSSVWFVWIKDERNWEAQILDGIYECVQEVESGQVTLVSGATIFSSEIFSSTQPPDVTRLINKLTQSRKVQLLESDPRVFNLRAEIREHYKSRAEKVPSVPDAEHLAYAIHYRVDEFWALDDGKRGDRSLLRLDGNVAGYRLKITVPHAKQGRIPGIFG